MRFAGVTALILVPAGLLTLQKSGAQDSGHVIPAGEAAANDIRVADALPEDALLRLGTTRLRQGQHVSCVAFSPGGEFLVSAGGDDSIRFWNVDTWRQVRRLKSTQGTLAIAFSPGGRLLASVGGRGNVRLWDVNTGKLRFDKVGHARQERGVRVNSVYFSPDGLTFATVGADEYIRLWDVATGTELLTLHNADGSRSHPLAISPDGSMLACGSGTRNGVIRIWNLTKGARPLQINEAHERGVSSLAFTPDGGQLISAGYTFQRVDEHSIRYLSQIRIWDCATGENVGEFSMENDLIGNCSLALSRDGQVLCTSHFDKVVVWDVASRKPTQVIEARARQLGGRPHGLTLSPDAKLIASMAFDHKVHVWDRESGRPVGPETESHVDAVIATAFSSDGSILATGSADSITRLWDANTGELLRRIGDNSGWVTFVEFFQADQRLAIGAETRAFKGQLSICDVADGTTVHRFPVDNRVLCGDVSAEGNRVAVGTGMGMYSPDDNTETRVLVWDTITSERVGDWSHEEIRVQQVDIGSGGERLWTLSEEPILRQWNVDSSKRLRDVEFASQIGGPIRLGCTKWHPESDALFVGKLDRPNSGPNRGTLIAVSVTTSEVLWRKTMPDHWPTEMSVSPDGRILATFLKATSHSRVNNRITLLSAADGEELRSFVLEEGLVRSLEFSPDAKRLASGMDRGHTLIWDTSFTHRTP